MGIGAAISAASDRFIISPVWTAALHIQLAYGGWSTMYTVHQWLVSPISVLTPHTVCPTPHCTLVAFPVIRNVATVWLMQGSSH